MITKEKLVKKSFLSSRKISIQFKKILKELEPGVRLLILPNRFFVEFFCKICLKTYFPLKIIGQKNIPKDSSFILVSNHSSHIDTGVLGTVSGVEFTRLAMLAAKDYWFENKIRRFLIYFFFNLIPIERKFQRNQDEKNRIPLNQTIDFCKKFIAKDRSAIIIYPEGTRTRDGEIQKFKDGASKLAIQLQIPIVPVYLKGTYYALSRKDRLPKPTRILAVVGEPIFPPKNYKEMDKKEIISACQKITEDSYQQITGLKTKYA